MLTLTINDGVAQGLPEPATAPMVIAALLAVSWLRRR